MLGSISEIPSYLFSFVFGKPIDNFANSAPVPPPGPTRPCRFRMDDDSSATFELPDGRKLGYAEYGAPNGKPIFCFHGMPGSRVEGAFFHQTALKHNARIIYLDRPGIGWSSPYPNRTTLDHAKDVERLGEHLGLDKYLVMATSGGGPYGMACAYSMPKDKLKGVSIVVGIGSPDMSKRGMSWLNYTAFVFGKYLLGPSVAKSYFGRMPNARFDLDIEKRVDLMREDFRTAKLHPREKEFLEDRERLEDEWRVVTRIGQEAFGKGYEAVAQDAMLLTTPWAFRIEDIRKDLPVQLWYATHDEKAPPVWGEESARRLGDNATLHLLNETHGSLQWHYQQQIIEDLVKLF